MGICVWGERATGSMAFAARVIRAALALFSQPAKALPRAVPCRAVWPFGSREPAGFTKRGFERGDRLGHDHAAARRLWLDRVVLARRPNQLTRDLCARRGPQLGGGASFARTSARPDYACRDAAHPDGYAKGGLGMSEAILFDRDRVERLEDLSDRPRRLSGGRLLWVDLDDRTDESAERVAEAFALDAATRDRLASSSGPAVFHDRGRYLHLTTYAPCDEDGENMVALECVIGENWVITAHEQPVSVLEAFAERAAGSGDTGLLDGPAFVATLLEWVLGAYTAAFERIEKRLEEFDVQAMRGQGSENDIEQLVAMRREVGQLRRALAGHRSALVALTHPELEALGDHASAERFQSLLRRFDSTLQEARDAREAIVGSFDVLIARTGQRTNEIMKVLTLASVILLPGALLAGLMGMNFKVDLFTHPWLFYLVLVLIALVAAVAIGVAKLRDWI
jgi:magnesium transporter